MYSPVESPMERIVCLLSVLFLVAMTRTGAWLKILALDHRENPHGHWSGALDTEQLSYTRTLRNRTSTREYGSKVYFALR